MEKLSVILEVFLFFLAVAVFVSLYLFVAFRCMKKENRDVKINPVTKRFYGGW